MFAIRYASEELRNDRGIVISAIKNNGLALRYVSTGLRNDMHIVIKMR